MAMLEVKDINVYYGLIHALRDVSFEVNEGEVVALIGANGAGKTTVFNLLTNVYQPTRGSILIDGMPTAGKKTYQVNRMGVARTFQNIRLFKDMPVLDNVKVGLHNHHSYSTLTGILRLPKYHKVEKEMNGSARSRVQLFAIRIEHMTGKLVNEK